MAINDKIELTDKEQEVNDRAVVEFKEGITYNNMIKKNVSMAETLAVDYGKHNVVRYRRSQRIHYHHSSHADGYKI